MEKKAYLIHQKEFQVTEDMVHISSFVMVKRGNEVLLEKLSKEWKGHNAGKWVLPGVILNYGEHPDDAAVRVFTEELEVKPRQPKFLQIQTHLGDKGHWDLCFVYESEPLDEEELKPSEGIDELRYFPLDRLPDDIAQGSKDVIFGLKHEGRMNKPMLITLG